MKSVQISLAIPVVLKMETIHKNLPKEAFVSLDEPRANCRDHLSPKARGHRRPAVQSRGVGPWAAQRAGRPGARGDNRRPPSPSHTASSRERHDGPTARYPLDKVINYTAKKSRARESGEVLCTKRAEDPG